VVPVAGFQFLGRSYRNELAAAKAQSWEQAATQIAAGLEPNAAFQAAKDQFEARSRSVFEATIAPALERIAPGGDTSKSAELSAAFRDLAAGMKSP
jgi:hypothetical protein